MVSAGATPTLNPAGRFAALAGSPPQGGGENTGDSIKIHFALVPKIRCLGNLSALTAF
jgi:hypothetical protein